MRQSHPVGERLFVDYAGQTVDVIDPLTCEVCAAHILVAALGASNLTYAEARWSEGRADWLGCHVNAFAFFGGVPRQLVCDNLKAGVTTSSRYEPGINRSYQELATHYGTAVVPTRVRKPRDKAKVEVAVQVVQRWVLARLRHRQFFSLVALNAAIRELTDQLNDRPMRHLGVSRRALFDAGERDALRELPSEPYVYAGLISIIMSRFMASGIPYRLVWSANQSKLASPSRLWSCSIAACASPAISGARCVAVTPQSPSTCQARTDVMPTGRRGAYNAKQRRSVHQRPP
jgi:hypothetical protein